MNPSTSLPLVVVTNPVYPETLAYLRRFAQVDMNPELVPWTHQQLQARLRQATAMMGFMTDCVDATLLAQAPDLKIVACALKGYDSYDVQACTQAGVWVSIVPDLLTEPTAELAIGLAISLTRNISAGDAIVRSGQFTGWRAQLYGTGLHQSTVAVLGLGQVGSAIIDRLRGFGCARIVGVDPARSVAGVESVALEQALACADYLFLAAPLTASNRHLIDADMLQKAKPGQWIINVGRGSVIDEEALLPILLAGQIGGYAADVFAFEDWGLKNRPSEVSPALRACPNTLFTPHLGSAVGRVRRGIELRAADNILAVLRGEAPSDAINRPSEPSAITL